MNFYKLVEDTYTPITLSLSNCCSCLFNDARHKGQSGGRWGKRGVHHGRVETGQMCRRLCNKESYKKIRKNLYWVCIQVKIKSATRPITDTSRYIEKTDT